VTGHRAGMKRLAGEERLGRRCGGVKERASLSKIL